MISYLNELTSSFSSEGILRQLDENPTRIAAIGLGTLALGIGLGWLGQRLAGSRLTRWLRSEPTPIPIVPPPQIDERTLVLAAVQQNGFDLRVASEALRNDRDIVLAAVQQYGSALRYASEALRNDREIVLAAVQQYGNALEFASDALRNDRDIVLAAVQQYGFVLRLASEAHRNDRDIVLVAVQTNSFALEYASEALRNDREIVLVAVQELGSALQYASEALRNNREIVLAAVQTNRFALEFASDALRSDPEIQNAAGLRFERPALTAEQILASPNALRMTATALDIHPLILERHPERVLRLLASRTSAETPLPRIYFLNDQLHSDEGVDAGGLSRHLMSELFRNLFSGRPDAKLNLVHQMPSLSEGASEEQIQLLRDLGVLLARCYRNEGLISGRVLSDEYFEFLKMVAQSNVTLERQIEYLASKDDHANWMLSLMKADSISEEDLRKLRELGIVDVDSEDLKTELRDYLINLYQPIISASREVLAGMLQEMPIEELQQASFQEISARIQGLQFDRQEIARRISTENQGLRETTVWLQDHIRNPETPQKWAEDFLLAVTGQRELNAHTHIHVIASQDGLCRSHTCFNQLEAPLRASREQFFEALDTLIAHGSGFQIA